MIQDISNKLLEQFVTCLQDRVGTAEEPAPTARGGRGRRRPVEPRPPRRPWRPRPADRPPPTAAPRLPHGRPRASSSADDALDLGATVLPILARTYGPQVGIALVALVIGYLLGRRRG